MARSRGAATRSIIDVEASGRRGTKRRSCREQMKPDSQRRERERQEGAADMGSGGASGLALTTV